MKFKIICLDCNKECHPENWLNEDLPISVYAEHTGYVIAKCECGNEKQIG